MTGEAIAIEGQPSYAEAYAAAYARARTELREAQDVVSVFMMLLGGPFIAVVFITRAYKRYTAALLAQAHQDG